MLLPGVELAILVDGALELMIACGAINIVAEIVFPRPLQLDRPVELERDGRGLTAIVIDQPSAEAAADASLMDHDLFFLHPR
jgi:hypothetical protein